MGEEEAVEIHIEFQGQPTFDEGSGQQIKVGQQVFRLVDFGAGEDATAIIEHVDHRKGLGAVGEPGMRRGVQLPEFADLAALPAPHGSQRAVIGFGMGQVVLDGPATDLSPVEFEVAFAEHLAGSEAVGSRGFTAKPFVQKCVHLRRPVGRMIATGNPRGPGGLLMMGAGLKVIAIDFIEASTGQAELLGGGARFELSGTKQGQDVTDERSGTAMDQLEFFSFSSGEPNRTGGRCPPDPLGFFALKLETAGACRAGITPARPAVYKPPVGAQVASPQSPILRWSASSISALEWGTRGAKQKSAFDRTSAFANYSRPVLLAPRQEVLYH